VVEWVGLVASGYQFFSRLAAVFAEEVGELSVLAFFIRSITFFGNVPFPGTVAGSAAFTANPPEKAPGHPEGGHRDNSQCGPSLPIPVHVSL
jgi:hypothetical protein|tara:strand:- start:317 stop:592 length:276 start_codon:yes stop_codon:yes gene_type:complete